MDIKLIAMDMDGTLLKSNNQISEKTKEILLRVQKKGIRLALASGRSYCKLMEYAKELQMDIYGGYLIEVNGMAIYDVKKQKRHIRKRMPKEDAQHIFRYFQQFKVEIIGHLDDGMYDYNPKEILEEKKQYIAKHHLPKDIPYTGGAFEFVYDNRKGYPNIYYIESAQEITCDLNKVSITYHPEVMDKVSREAAKHFKDTYWVGRTTKKWLEIMMKDVTKASGLKELCDNLGISFDNVMAFGDGENDIEMLRECGIGIAMANALPKVKEAADAVTLSNEEDGIAQAILKYLFS
ncbi:HAD family hydrolase [Amedibacterium intestinale]|uniref:HAD family hydrolase n=1 Tax=Amedibacterium intestinale TaxID=2583452 RepID=UPI00399677EA